MKDIPDGSIDAVICDPPYGTTACKWDTVIPFEQMWEQLNRVIKNNGAIILMASQPFTSALISSNYKMFKYCWYWEKERLTNISQVKKRAGKTVEECVVFYNKQPTYNPQMIKYLGEKRTNKVKHGVMGKLTDSGTKRVNEYIDTGYRYPTQVLKIQRDVLKSNLHPTQKPVALMEYLIKTYSNEGETILDFAAGSCTTGVACVNLNRNYMLIEKEQKYCDIGQKRIDEIIR